MTETVMSADGTEIAYERTGTGPTVILVGGALSSRQSGAGLAEEMSDHFTVYAYDRRGRGASGDTKPYDVSREVDDIAALAALSDEPPYLYGHSSGGALVLEAANRGLAAAGLAVYEPPYMVAGEPDDGYAELVSKAVEEGRPEEALALFIGNAMPDALDGMRQSPYWASLVGLAPTLPYDIAIVGDGAIPNERFDAITVPTLLLDGSVSPAWAARAVDAIAASVPSSVRRTVEGYDHSVPNEVIAPILIEFFGQVSPVK
jgi:pimeloyl-ACP methyl ester carboxylesterase